MQSETGLSGSDILNVVQQLSPRLERAARQRYGDSVSNAAWQDFSRWGLAAIAREEHAYQSAFNAWYLFSWLPDDTSLDGDTFNSPLSDHSIAYDFLKTHRQELSPVEQGVIEIATTAPYSFYAVQSVTNDGRLKLQELYTERNILVATDNMRLYEKGDLLFSAVISVNSVPVLLGCMPHVLTGDEQAIIQSHREKWQAEEGGAIDQRLLYLHDTELRRLYFLLLSKKQQARLH